MPGAVNWPLSSLRQQLPSLPRDKKLYVYCQVRARVHWAGRIVRGRPRIGLLGKPAARPEARVCACCRVVRGTLSRLRAAHP